MMSWENRQKEIKEKEELLDKLKSTIEDIESDDEE